MNLPVLWIAKNKKPFRAARKCEHTLAKSEEHMSFLLVEISRDVKLGCLNCGATTLGQF